MPKDREYRRMIHTGRWLRLRREVLTRHPLCARCEAEGYVTAATEVHHRVPVESAVNPGERERLMYDPKNLVPLCHRCHVKTHTELREMSEGAFPLTLTHAVMMLAAHWYNQRESVSGVQMTEVPDGLSSLIKPYRRLV